MRLITCIALFLATGLSAQDRADFAGDWILAEPTSVGDDVASELSVEQSPGPPVTITVERRSKATAWRDWYAIGTAGGSVGGVDRYGRGSGPNGEVPRSGYSSKWNGNTLVLERHAYSGATAAAGPFSETEETWLLDDAGRLVISLTERTEVEAKTIMLTYRRK